MKLFMFEWLVGGGLLIDDHPLNPADPMLRQGWAMASALATDLCNAGHEVRLLLDARLKNQWPGCDANAQFVHSLKHQDVVGLAQEADATWVIAPESGGRLGDLTKRLELANCRLVTPDSRFVALAGSKQATAEFFASHGVQPNEGSLFAVGSAAPVHLRPPFVIKPDDGAGSDGVVLVDSASGVAERASRDCRVEPFFSGTAVSLAVIQGPATDALLLEPLYQQFDRQPFGHYVGGAFPVEPTVRDRARALVQRAIAVLPTTKGFIGFDLVIDSAQPATRDRIVDVNPRLTTSYVGLRDIYRENLADLALRIALGHNRSVALTLVESKRSFRVT